MRQYFHTGASTPRAAQYMLILCSFCSAPRDIWALTLLSTGEGTQSFCVNTLSDERGI